jgi:aldose 1-dehydrogenase [NAD(P)+]
VKSIIVKPPKAGVEIVDLDLKEKLSAKYILVKTIENGICGTDRGIANGNLSFARVPSGYDYLILGHETLGMVIEVGDEVKGIKKGDLVVPIVRRGCNNCLNCLAGRQDYCETGQFSEIGIRGLHGTMREFFIDEEKNLVVLPKSLKEIGVLLEPLSNIVKTFEAVGLIQKRMIWNCQDSSFECRNAGIIGSGPIGLLFALLSRSKGFNVYVTNKREPSSLEEQICNAIEAKFINMTKDEIPNFDLLIDTSGYPSAFIPLIDKINKNGLLVLFGTTSKDSHPLDTNLVNHIVESNITILGSVNASKNNFIEGVNLLSAWNNSYPELLKKLITNKVKAEDAIPYILNKPKGEIKTVIIW